MLGKRRSMWGTAMLAFGAMSGLAILCLWTDLARWRDLGRHELQSIRVGDTGTKCCKYPTFNTCTKMGQFACTAVEPGSCLGSKDGTCTSGDGSTNTATCVSDLVKTCPAPTGNTVFTGDSCTATGLTTQDGCSNGWWRCAFTKRDLPISVTPCATIDSQCNDQPSSPCGSFPNPGGT